LFSEEYINPKRSHFGYGNYIPLVIGKQDPTFLEDHRNWTQSRLKVNYLVLVQLELQVTILTIVTFLSVLFLQKYRHKMETAEEVK